jgi:hypothetical protein
VNWSFGGIGLARVGDLEGTSIMCKFKVFALLAYACAVVFTLPQHQFADEPQMIAESIKSLTDRDADTRKKALDFLKSRAEQALPALDEAVKRESDPQALAVLEAARKTIRASVKDDPTEIVRQIKELYRGDDSLRVLVGHRAPLRTAAFSPDGKLLATGGSDKTVQVWEVDTGKRLAVLEGHTDSILALSWSGDGKILASASKDRSIRIWGVPLYRQAALLEGHSDAVLCVALSSDGKLVASGSADKTAQIWDSSTGKQVSSFVRHAEPVKAIAFASTSGHVFSGAGKEMWVWVAKEGRAIRSKDLPGLIDRIVFVDDNSSLITVSTYSAKGTVLESGEPSPLPFHSDVIEVWSFEKVVESWVIVPQRTLTTKEDGGTANAVTLLSKDKVLLAIRGSKLLQWDINNWQRKESDVRRVGTSVLALGGDSRMASSGLFDTVLLWQR